MDKDMIRLFSMPLYDEIEDFRTSKRGQEFRDAFDKWVPKDKDKLDDSSHTNSSDA